MIAAAVQGRRGVAALACLSYGSCSVAVQAPTGGSVGIEGNSHTTLEEGMR